MLKNHIRPLLTPIVGLGLAAVAAGIWGCNQEADPASSGVVSAPAGPVPVGPGIPGAGQLGEGRLMEGEDLEAFLKSRSLEEPASALPPVEVQAAPSAKTAAYDRCLIDFNSPKGLGYMPDRAHTNYATSPYYTQPCNLHYATVRPINRNYYYLPPEATGTCVGSYGKIGIGPPTNCPNQQDAAKFPRYAGNGSPTDGNLQLQVKIPEGQNKRDFRLNFFFARSGSITVHAYRVGIGWWWWGPIDVAPGFFAFTNAERVNEVIFRSSDNKSIFTLDNIGIQPL